MRKEYIPAILIYILSALCFVASVVFMIKRNIHWSTLILLGIAIMIFASAVLVKIGKRLREDDEKNQNKNI